MKFCGIDVRLAALSQQCASRWMKVCSLLKPSGWFKKRKRSYIGLKLAKTIGVRQGPQYQEASRQYITSLVLTFCNTLLKHKRVLDMSDIKNHHQNTNNGILVYVVHSHTGNIATVKTLIVALYEEKPTMMAISVRLQWLQHIHIVLYNYMKELLLLHFHFHHCGNCCDGSEKPLENKWAWLKLQICPISENVQ